MKALTNLNSFFGTTWEDNSDFPALEPVTAFSSHPVYNLKWLFSNIKQT